MTGRKPLHAVALEVASGIESGEPVIDLKAVTTRLTSVAVGDELAWAIESLVVLSSRLEALRPALAISLLEVASSAAARLSIAAGEIAAQRVESALLSARWPVSAPPRPAAEDAPDGEPAWKLKPVAALPRRV